MATRAFFRFPDRYLLSSHSAPAAAIQMIGRGTVGALRGAAASSWSPPASNVVSLLHTRRRPSTGCGGPLTLHQVPAALMTTSAVPVAARETAAKATAAAGAPKTPSRQLTTCRAFGRNAAFPNVSLSSPLSYHHSQGPPRCLLSTGPQRVPPGAPPVTTSAVEVAPESAEWPAGELEGAPEVRFDLSRIPGTENARDGHMTLVFTCCKCNKRSAKKFSKVAYTQGVVIVQCPGCSNLHLVADRLKWFGEEESDVETILAAKGEKVLRTLTASHLLDIEGLDCRAQASDPPAQGTKA
ncbi:hypothetical protein, conserved [Eimeria acervulina]|uniref:DNL-type domain-containing protein n=1 Tax=Eimeria acervulina TaxID=5801 RepID=U6G7Y5_EIMAC|nr:hypothetical protein, conserved [Eimeria acervulina]CDI76295.1 hypothetical protein, conserved [Eimeria acervulina]